MDNYKRKKRPLETESNSNDDLPLSKRIRHRQLFVVLERLSESFISAMTRRNYTVGVRNHEVASGDLSVEIEETSSSSNDSEVTKLCDNEVVEIEDTSSSSDDLEETRLPDVEDEEICSSSDDLEESELCDNKVEDEEICSSSDEIEELELGDNKVEDEEIYSSSDEVEVTKLPYNEVENDETSSSSDETESTSYHYSNDETSSVHISEEIVIKEECCFDDYLSDHYEMLGATSCYDKSDQPSETKIVISITEKEKKWIEENIGPVEIVPKNPEQLKEITVPVSKKEENIQIEPNKCDQSSEIVNSSPPIISLESPGSIHNQSSEIVNSSPPIISLESPGSIQNQSSEIVNSSPPIISRESLRPIQAKPPSSTDTQLHVASNVEDNSSSQSSCSNESEQQTLDEIAIHTCASCALFSEEFISGYSTIPCYRCNKPEIEILSYKKHMLEIHDVLDNKEFQRFCNYMGWKTIFCFECLLCGRSNKSFHIGLSKLKQHIQDEHLHCSVCEYSMGRLTAHNHFLSHENEFKSIFTCTTPSSQVEFSSEEEMLHGYKCTMHTTVLKVPRNVGYDCPYCFYSTTCMKVLTFHLRFHCRKRCPQCRRNFMPTLRHISKHEKNPKCCQCNGWYDKPLAVNKFAFRKNIIFETEFGEIESELMALKKFKNIDRKRSRRNLEKMKKMKSSKKQNSNDLKKVEDLCEESTEVPKSMSSTVQSSSSNSPGSFKEQTNSSVEVVDSCKNPPDLPKSTNSTVQSTDGSTGSFHVQSSSSPVDLGNLQKLSDLQKTENHFEQRTESISTEGSSKQQNSSSKEAMGLCEKAPEPTTCTVQGNVHNARLLNVQTGSSKQIVGAYKVQKLADFNNLMNGTVEKNVMTTGKLRVQTSSSKEALGLYKLQKLPVYKKVTNCFVQRIQIRSTAGNLTLQPSSSTTQLPKLQKFTNSSSSTAGDSQQQTSSPNEAKQLPSKITNFILQNGSTVKNLEQKTSSSKHVVDLREIIPELMKITKFAVQRDSTSGRFSSTQQASSSKREVDLSEIFPELQKITNCTVEIQSQKAGSSKQNNQADLCVANSNLPSSSTTGSSTQQTNSSKDTVDLCETLKNTNCTVQETETAGSSKQQTNSSKEVIGNCIDLDTFDDSSNSSIEIINCTESDKSAYVPPLISINCTETDKSTLVPPVMSSNCTETDKSTLVPPVMSSNCTETDKSTLVPPVMSSSITDTDKSTLVSPVMSSSITDTDKSTLVPPVMSRKYTITNNSNNPYDLRVCSYCDLRHSEYGSCYTAILMRREKEFNRKIKKNPTLNLAPILIKNREFRKFIQDIEKNKKLSSDLFAGYRTMFYDLFEDEDSLFKIIQCYKCCSEKMPSYDLYGHMIDVHLMDESCHTEIKQYMSKLKRQPIRTYRCLLCEKTNLKGLKNLNAHVAKHLCRICRCKTDDPKCMQHIVKHEYEFKNAYQCNICKLEFSMEDAFQLHVKHYHPIFMLQSKHPKPTACYPCPYCHFVSNLIVVIEFHLSQHNIATCTSCKHIHVPNAKHIYNSNHTICMKCDSRGEGMEMIEHPPPPVKKGFPCLFCTTLFRDELEVFAHMVNTHMVCLFCKYLCNSVATFNLHMESAHGIIQYRCDKCLKIIPHKNGLMIHCNTEHPGVSDMDFTEVKSFKTSFLIDKQCPYCLKQFVKQVELTDHIKAAHGIKQCGKCTMYYFVRNGCINCKKNKKSAVIEVVELK